MASASEGYAITTDHYANQYRIMKWNGSTWSISDSPWGHPVGPVFADGNGNVIAGGDGNAGQGQLRYSLNSGSSWAWGEDRGIPYNGVWIDESGNWYYSVGVYAFWANIGLYKSADPSTAFTIQTTVTNPHTLRRISKYENCMWSDGTDFYILGRNGSSGYHELLYYDGSQNWHEFPTSKTAPFNHVFGVNPANVFIAANNNLMGKFNGSSLTETNIQAGGTSAHYYGVYAILEDTTQPALQNQVPGPGDTGVSVNTDVDFRIFDTESAIDQSTVVIQLKRGSNPWETVWQNDTEQLPGYAVTKTEYSSTEIGYTINPEVVFDNGQTVQIRVQADDQAVPANSLDDTYSFTIAEGVLWYAVTRGAHVRVSTDGGATWNTHSAPSGATRLFCIHGLDANNIWVGDLNGRIYYFNGSTWTEQLNVPTNYPEDIWMVNANLGYAKYYTGGEIQKVYKWDGNNWSEVLSHGGIIGAGIWADSNDVIYGRGSSGLPYKAFRYSEDQGATWPTGGPNVGAATIGTFKDGSYWHFTAYNNGVYRGVDLSGSFSQLFAQPSGHTLKMYGVSGGNKMFVQDGEVFVAASENAVSTSPKKIIHYDGTVNVYGPTSKTINCVYGASKNDVKYGLSDGYVANFNGSGFTETYIGVNSTVYDIWSTGDTGEPYLENKTPTNNSIGVDKNTNISFEIIDEKTSVNQSTVVVQIDKGSGYETIWTGDAQQTGYTVAKTELASNQIKYVINPDASLPYNTTVTIRVQADDANGNSMDETFSFEIELNNVWYVSGGRGGGSPYGKIYRSLNKVNWSEMNSLPSSGSLPVRCIHGVNPNNIWCGLNGTSSIPGSIWYFNGSAWSKQYEHVLGYTYVTSIHMVSESEGYAASYFGVTTKTVYVLKWDGNSWSIIHQYNTGGNFCTTIHARGSAIMLGLYTSNVGDDIIKYSPDGGANWYYGADEVSPGGDPIAGGSTSGVWVGDNGKYYWMRKYSGLYMSTSLGSNFTRIVSDSLSNGYFSGAQQGNCLWGSGGDDLYYPNSLGPTYGANAIAHWNGSVEVITDINHRSIASLFGASQAEIGAATNISTGGGDVTIYNGITHTVIADESGFLGDMMGVYGFGDITPPSLQNQDPFHLETDVDQEKNIYFEIIDDISAITQSSVIIDIDRSFGWETVWQNDAQSSEFAVTKNVINDSLISYTVNPDDLLKGGQTVQMRVRASDAASNAMNETYYFTVETIVNAATSSLDVIGQDGGYEVTFTGQFPVAQNMAVYLGFNGTSDDPRCFGGVYSGLNVQSEDGTTMTIYSPRYNPGEKGTLKLTVAYDGFDYVFTGLLDLVERRFLNKQFNYRNKFPNWMALGTQLRDKDRI